MKWSAVVVGMVAVALANPARANPATTAPPTKVIELEPDIMPTWTDLGTSARTKKIRLARVFSWWWALEARDKRAIKALYSSRSEQNAANAKIKVFYDGAETCLRKQPEYKRQTREQVEAGLAEVAACIKKDVETPTFTVLASQSLPEDFYDLEPIDFGDDNDEDEDEDADEDEGDNSSVTSSTSVHTTTTGDDSTAQDEISATNENDFDRFATSPEQQELEPTTSGDDALNGENPESTTPQNGDPSDAPGDGFDFIPMSDNDEPKDQADEEPIDGDVPNAMYTPWEMSEDASETETPADGNMYTSPQIDDSDRAWLANQWQVVPASPDVPPLWALDLDLSRSVDENEWWAYVTRLHEVATKAAMTGRDATAVELLKKIIDFHYGALRQCVGSRIQEESAWEQNEEEFSRIARWVEDNCFVKFRYSLFAGVPPFEWISRDRPVMPASDILVWFDSKAQRARHDLQAQRTAISVSHEQEQLTEKFIGCTFERLRSAGDALVTRDQYYLALHEIENCTAN